MFQRQVTFGEAIKRALTVNYCKFSGRSSRSEYWWFSLFSCIVSWLASLIQWISPTAGLTLSILISLGLFLPSLGLTVRRLHDIGKSGWWLVGLYAIVFVASIGCAIPLALIARDGLTPTAGTFTGVGIGAVLIIIASIILIVWMCKPSQPEFNQYGPVPNTNA